MNGIRNIGSIKSESVTTVSPGLFCYPC